MSAPADKDASQLDYSCLIISGGRLGRGVGGGWRWGGGEVGRWGAVDTRCLAGQVNYTIGLQL